MFLERVPPAWDKPRLRGGERSLSTSAVASSWPTDFPNGCPERVGARPVEGEVYHLIFPSNHKRAGENFQSSLQRGVPEHAHEDPCIRAALSCYRTLRDIQQVKTSVPRFANRLITRAVLTPDHGQIKQTLTPPHHSLWLTARYANTCESLFVVVE